MSKSESDLTSALLWGQSSAISASAMLFVLPALHGIYTFHCQVQSGAAQLESPVIAKVTDYARALLLSNEHHCCKFELCLWHLCKDFLINQSPMFSSAEFVFFIFHLQQK